MTTTIQLLQDLEAELEQHVSEFEQEVLRQVKELEAGSQTSTAASPGRRQEPEPEPETAPRPQARDFGIGADWQGRFNNGGLERGSGSSGSAAPSPTEPAASSQPAKKNKRWKGLRGIWNWLMHGSADGPDQKPKFTPWTKDQWKEKGWKYENVRKRPTLTEYLETQKRYDQFADELISEIIDRTAGQNANELEGHPIFGPLFRNFRQKIRDTFNRYRKQMGGGDVMASDFPSEPDPNHLTRNDDDDDERNQLNDPEVTQGAYDDSSPEDIEGAYRADAERRRQADVGQADVDDKQNKLFAKASENLSQVAAGVQKGEVEEPNPSWFTGKNKIKKYKLPNALAWLIAHGKVDDPNDGGSRPVNILNSEEVREALRSTGYTGPGNILSRVASHLGISGNQDEIRKQILIPLGWQHGASSKPEPVATGAVTKPKPKPAKRKEGGGPSWKNKSLADIVDDAVGSDVEDSLDEPSPEDLAALHKAAGFTDEDEPKKYDLNEPEEPKDKAPKRPVELSGPKELGGIGSPTGLGDKGKPETQKPNRKGSLEALTDKMVGILDGIDDEEKKAELAKGWARIKKRLKDDKGHGDYTMQDLLDYLKTAEQLGNVVQSRPKAGRVPGSFFSHYDPTLELNNESLLTKIKASKLKPEELKEFYKSLLRG